MLTAKNKKALIIQRFFLAVLSACSLLCSAVSAHHSYSDYSRNERSVFKGHITDIQWANPHIILSISDDTTSMRIEWIAAQRAGLQGLAKEQMVIGDEIVIIGSRNRNPERFIMTLIKEITIPDKSWHWVSKSLATAR